MSLLEHLEELRRRILWSLASVVVAFAACWVFAGRIFGFLARPIYGVLPEGQRLTFLGVTDPLVLYVKVAALAAVFVASPVILFHVWRFVAPGLYRQEKRYALPFILLGTFFFLAGGAFAYYVAFPFAVEFLVGVGDEFQAMITVERYFRFLMTVILGLGLMFELPILILLLAQMGLVTPRGLLRQFRWAVVIIFFVAAVVTPTPDPVNLFLFALPTIALYLLGVGGAALVSRRRAAAAAARAPVDPGGSVADQ